MAETTTFFISCHFPANQTPFLDQHSPVTCSQIASTILTKINGNGMFQACRDAPYREVWGGSGTFLHSSLCTAGMIGQNKTPKGNMACRWFLCFRSLSPSFLFFQTSLSDRLLPTVLVPVYRLKFSRLDTKIFLWLALGAVIATSSGQ